ncbi:hypothetical protein H8356DRAFT_962796 [Neocallimastix lanati (nom. inval.)]|nr:hypothetical protein H8356DRAFT_962796 [Neocallimastix sp. JGI-2020a]
MAEDSKKSRNNLVHFLDEDEIENELTFFEEDGRIDFNSNHAYNKNQFKKRKLFNTNTSNQNFERISPISFAPNVSSIDKQSFAVHNTINNKRKNKSMFTSFNNEIQDDVTNSYEIDSNEPFMPAHKSIKIDTNSDAITSPIVSASTSPVYTSTPIAISTPISKRDAIIPVRSSTPIVPPSALKSEGSFSSISSISSINKSKNDSNLLSIRDDLHSIELTSSSNFINNSSNNDIIPNSVSTPISIPNYSSDSSHLSELRDEENLKNVDDIKDIFSTEKLMNSKLIINLPSSVRNKNLYWNLGINSSDSPFLSFTKELNENNSMLSPNRSPILKNNGNSSDYSSSPVPYQKQKKSESTGSELVLFKPIPWKQPLQNMIESSVSDNSLIISTNQNKDMEDNSFNSINNVSNSSTPTSAVITNELPFLSISKTPDKQNNSYTTSDAIPIPTTQNNSSINMNTSSILPISPISMPMNLDNSLMSSTNSSPSSRKEMEIPHSEETYRYYGNLSSSSFSTSPSPITSSALMNRISRNNTELQSNIKFVPNKINTEGNNKNNYTDLFDYKDDLLPSNIDHHDNDTIPTTNTVGSNNNNNNTQPADSMDVDF